MKTYLVHIALFFCIVQQFYSQESVAVALDLPVRNSLKFNKYVINPTFSFVREQHKYISFNNKRQWVQFDNAPQTYLFSYSGRFRENIGVGLGIFQQNYGVLTNFGGVANFAYNAVLNRDSNLTFGTNLSFYKSGINNGSVVTNFPDSSLENILSSSILTISPGINYGTAYFDFGVSVNNLVSYNLTTSKIIEDNPQQSIQGHIMYTGYVDSRGFLDESKFSGLVRSELKKEKTILSGIIMLTVPKGFWGQVGYNTLYGFSAGIGLNISSQIALEYNYEKSIGDLATFGNSHDITLAYKFKNRYRYDYSGDDEEGAILIPAKKTRRPIAKRSSSKKSTTRVAAKPKKPENAVTDTSNTTNSNLEAKEKEAEAERIRLEEAAKAKLLEEERLKAETEAKEKEAEAERIRLEEAAKTKLLEEERLKAEETEAKEKEAEAERIRLEEAAKAKLLEEERLKAETEAKEKEAEAERIRLEEAAKAKLLEEERLKAETEAKEKEAEAERIRLEEAAKAKLLEEERLKAETEAKEKEAERIRLEEAAKAKESIIIEGASKAVNDIAKSAQDAKKEQQELLNQLSEKIAGKQKDLDDLKEENDLSEQGIYKAPKPFKSVTAENAALEALKFEIENVINTQDQKILELEDLYNERLKRVRSKNDSVNVRYLKAIQELKSNQLQSIKTKEDLLANLEVIKTATEIERKRRIKRAAYDNEEDRYLKDRAALNQIKQNTIVSSEPLSEDDFDSGEELSNIQIIKDIKNVENGYYLVIAIHSDVGKRDEFLTKAVSAGQANINFFYDVNTSKYYIYYNKFENIDAAKRAMESERGSKPYNGKMSMVKIENE